MTYKMKSTVGRHFDDCAAKAKELSIESDETVEFEFNGVICLVNPKTDLEKLYRDYSNSWTMEWKSVGPVCRNYSPELQAEYDRRKKAKDEQQQKQQAAYDAKCEEERALLEGQLAGVELHLSDTEGWNKSREVNSDGYGGAALDYAEAWAKKMQIEIAKGHTVAECADETQNGLGFLGITGFQYGYAVSILSQTWKHGEELRKWHNKIYKHKQWTCSITKRYAL